MSEYQYYEFLALDRPLTTAEQARQQQRRAEAHKRLDRSRSFERAADGESM